MSTLAQTIISSLPGFLQEPGTGFLALPSGLMVWSLLSGQSHPLTMASRTYPSSAGNSAVSTLHEAHTDKKPGF